MDGSLLYTTRLHCLPGNTATGDFRITAVNLEQFQCCFSALALIYPTPMPSPGSRFIFSPSSFKFTLLSGFPVPRCSAGKAPGHESAPWAGTICPPRLLPSISLTSRCKHIYPIFIFLHRAFLINIKNR